MATRGFKQAIPCRVLAAELVLMAVHIGVVIPTTEADRRP